MFVLVKWLTLLETGISLQIRIPCKELIFSLMMSWEEISIKFLKVFFFTTILSETSVSCHGIFCLGQLNERRHLFLFTFSEFFVTKGTFCELVRNFCYEKTFTSVWTFKDLFLQHFMKFLYYTNKTEEQSVNFQEFFLIDLRALQQQDILMKSHMWTCWKFFVIFFKLLRFMQWHTIYTNIAI